MKKNRCERTKRPGLFVSGEMLDPESHIFIRLREIEAMSHVPSENQNSRIKDEDCFFVVAMPSSLEL